MFSTIVGTFLTAHFLGSVDTSPLHSFAVLLLILAFHQALFRWLEGPFTWRAKLSQLWSHARRTKAERMGAYSVHDLPITGPGRHQPALNPTFSQLDFHSVRITESFPKAPSRDAESCDWLNYFFQGLWKRSIESNAWNEVQRGVYQFLNKHKPDFLESIEINIDPGRHPPTFIDMRHIRSSSTEMEFESKCQFVGDARIDVTARFKVPFMSATMFSIPVSATDCTFLGQVWVGIKSHEEFPFIDTISLAFLSRPRITVKVNTVAQLNVFQVPLISEWLKMMITEKAIDALVYPKRFTVNVRDILMPPCPPAKVSVGTGTSD